ncbi:MAG: transcriptional repressor LexA [Candidatus Nanopelagicales bacterium]|jgi:repressor LexA|nr:transcriptional repressor LexA [Actinomycetota bacterium]
MTNKPDSDLAQISPDGDGLTDRQRKILNVIQDAVKDRGFPPTVREIADLVGLASPASVAHQLSALERKGFIKRDPNSPRAIDLTLPNKSGVAIDGLVGGLEGEQTPEAAFVPLVGRIAAGGPILAEESIEAIYPLPKELVGNGELFMLEVVGDSMIDAAICHGDKVVVRKQDDAQNGEIVAALLGDEATVKTLKRKDGHVWLMPANPNYEPINGDHAKILGRVVTVMRKI